MVAGTMENGNIVLYLSPARPCRERQIFKCSDAGGFSTKPNLMRTETWRVCVCASDAMFLLLPFGDLARDSQPLGHFSDSKFMAVA